MASSNGVVLDASALLALLMQEPGHEVVAKALSDGPAALSAANLSEAASKLAEHGFTEAMLKKALAVLDLEIVPVDEAIALSAGFMIQRTRALGLSLGDRLCLATAGARGVAALTTDRIWSKLRGGPQVIVIR